MSKPIDKLDFWKERIDTARKPHFSVYVTSENDWKRIYDSHKKIIEALIDKNDRVLDAGCGYGRMSTLFNQNNYVGVDFSPDFINWSAKDNSKYKFVCSNLKSLPFKDKEFDWSFCVSIKKMIIDNLGEKEWNDIEKELLRVSNKILILEYEDYLTHEIIK